MDALSRSLLQTEHAVEVDGFCKVQVEHDQVLSAEESAMIKVFEFAQKSAEQVTHFVKCK